MAKAGIRRTAPVAKQMMPVLAKIVETACFTRGVPRAVVVSSVLSLRYTRRLQAPDNPRFETTKYQDT